jgi:hypothetical protein
MSYEKSIKTLLDRFDHDIDGDLKRSATLELLNRLGCQTAWSTHGRTVTQPDAADEPLVRKTLVHCLLRFIGDVESDLHYQDGWSILDGLVRNDRWRDALQTLKGSYALVYLVTTVSQEYADVYKSARGSTFFERRQQLLSIKDPFCDLLNNWLHPSAPFSEVPEAETMIRAIFGDFWFELALADRADMAILWPSAIRALHPPFLPDITPAAPAEMAARTLPALDIT